MVEQLKFFCVLVLCSGSILSAIDVCAEDMEVFSPPMGWNSYTGYGIAVTEKELRKNIDFLSEHLLPYGYDTVTVDNGWFLSGKGKGISISLDAYGRPEAHPHFFPKGLKHTIDYAHSKGIKFGIWLLRGINRRAVEENLPVEGTPYHMRDIVNMKSYCGWAVAPWWNYGVDMTKPGAQEYYDGLIRKYAEMGVDFIKFDDMVPSPAEIRAVVRSIQKGGHDIMLSLSPGDTINVDHSDTYKMASMVRITSDIWDNRKSIETTFQRWEEMQDYDGPVSGSFLDMDMICFGRLSVNNDDGGRDCRFTEDQKRTFMVQRAMAASPLMLGGVLYTMDDFSMSLFKHPDILSCNRNGVIGKLVCRKGLIDVWQTPERSSDDNGWIGIFNRSESDSQNVSLSLKDLGLVDSSHYSFEDLWKGNSLSCEDSIKVTVPPDGVAFIRYEYKEPPCFLFSYFRGNGESGLHLAYSHDGLKWTPLNRDQPLLRPEVGGKLMRDPCITQGEDGVFHMVWTTSWHDKGIGFAHSHDLINWSPQTFLPVMKHETGAQNCWAPEICRDPVSQRFYIFWATTIPGRFPETDKSGNGKLNHRIYCTSTPDFKSFTETKLFYDPGFNVIDSTIVYDKNRFVMVFKDETLKPIAKNLRVATASSITGPWNTESDAFTPMGLWVEGPSILKTGSYWHVYYDAYQKHHYGVMRTRDFRTWENLTERLKLPSGARHGTAFAVSPKILDQLKALAPEK